jgi:hypothetical protein
MSCDYDMIISEVRSPPGFLRLNMKRSFILCSTSVPEIARLKCLHLCAHKIWFVLAVYNEGYLHGNLRASVGITVSAGEI